MHQNEMDEPRFCGSAPADVAAPQTSNDVQVGREEMPEAIKALQSFRRATVPAVVVAPTVTAKGVVGERRQSQDVSITESRSGSGSLRVGIAPERYA
jgi:hypothetical protein